MLESILFVAVIFATRILLPIIVVWLIGSLIERALNRGVHAAS